MAEESHNPVYNDIFEESGKVKDIYKVELEEGLFTLIPTSAGGIVQNDQSVTGLQSSVPILQNLYNGRGLPGFSLFNSDSSRKDVEAYINLLKLSAATDKYIFKGKSSKLSGNKSVETFAQNRKLDINDPETLDKYYNSLFENTIRTDIINQFAPLFNRPVTYISKKTRDQTTREDFNNIIEQSNKNIKNEIRHTDLIVGVSLTDAIRKDLQELSTRLLGEGSTGETGTGQEEGTPEEGAEQSSFGEGGRPPSLPQQQEGEGEGGAAEVKEGEQEPIARDVVEEDPTEINIDAYGSTSVTAGGLEVDDPPSSVIPAIPPLAGQGSEGEREQDKLAKNVPTFEDPQKVTEQDKTLSLIINSRIVLSVFDKISDYRLALQQYVTTTPRDRRTSSEDIYNENVNLASAFGAFPILSRMTNYASLIVENRELKVAGARKQALIAGQVGGLGQTPPTPGFTGQPQQVPGQGFPGQGLGGFQPPPGSSLGMIIDVSALGLTPHGFLRGETDLQLQQLGGRPVTGTKEPPKGYKAGHFDIETKKQIYNDHLNYRKNDATVRLSSRPQRQGFRQQIVTDNNKFRREAVLGRRGQPLPATSIKFKD